MKPESYEKRVDREGTVHVHDRVADEKPAFVQRVLKMIRDDQVKSTGTLTVRLGRQEHMHHVMRVLTNEGWNGL